MKKMFCIFLLLLVGCHRIIVIPKPKLSFSETTIIKHLIDRATRDVYFYKLGKAKVILNFRMNVGNVNDFNFLESYFVSQLKKNNIKLSDESELGVRIFIFQHLTQDTLDWLDKNKIPELEASKDEKTFFISLIYPGEEDNLSKEKNMYDKIIITILSISVHDLNSGKYIYNKKYFNVEAVENMLSSIPEEVL